MMHICILTRPDLEPTNHGAAVKIVETAQAFQRLGYPCVIVTENRDVYWSVATDGSFVKKPYPERFRALQEWPLFGGGQRRAERLCRWLGYPAEEYFLYTAQFDPAWLVRVMAVGLVEDIDVFQSEFPGFGMMAGLAARLLSKITGRSVQSSIVQHNVEWERLAQYNHQSVWIRRMERIALQWVDDVIAVSDADKQLMVQMGVDAAKITIIPHGVQVQQIRNAKERGVKWRQHYGLTAKRVVFFHGTLHYAPNTDAVRFIAEQILPLLPDLEDLRFVITGLNPPRYYTHPKIIFTDVVDDLAGHLQMADMFVCPLFAGGGTRLKLLEYLAVGKPIVTTEKGAEGIPNHGQFQYAETASAFATAIRQTLTQSDSVMIERVQFAHRLDWTVVTEEYVRLYQSEPGVRGHDRFAELLERPDVTGVEPMHLPRYQAVKPRTLLFLINRGCNLRCVFCDLWDNPENISLDRVEAILDDALLIGTKIVVLTGGEPLMHPDLQTIIAMIKSRGMVVNITTNGLLLNRHWSWIRTAGVASLSFSIDGFADVHDQLRGQQGAFERTMKAIKRVQKESDIPCSVYCTVTNQNVHQLDHLHEMFWTMGVKFDFWPVNDAPDLYMTSTESQKHWVDAVQQIMDRGTTYQSRASFYADSLKYHAGEVLDNRRCLGFIEQYGIKYNGDLLPCCVWEGEGLVVGNVFQTPLRELWFSEKVQNVRHAMVQDGCEVQCFNHSLYEYRAAVQDEIN